MTKAKELIGALFFSDHEPHIIGHLSLGNIHYEIVGIRRSATRADITGHKLATGAEQTDLFEDEQS
jgi:hypothetical protein